MLKKLLAAMLVLLATATFAAVDVNKASQADLETIKGIGPAISARILDERKKSSFKDWQDMIDRVKSVGEHNAATFSREGLTVNGAAFSGAPASPAKKENKTEPKAKNKTSAATTATPATAGATAATPMTTAEKKTTARSAKEPKKNEKKAAGTVAASSPAK